MTYHQKQSLWLSALKSTKLLHSVHMMFDYKMMLNFLPAILPSSKHAQSQLCDQLTSHQLEHIKQYNSKYVLLFAIWTKLDTISWSCLAELSSFLTL